MKTKKEFENDFDLIDPKKMVTFVDAFRKGEFYGMNKVTGLTFLLKVPGEKEIISMINSGNYFFGTKKQKKLYVLTGDVDAIDIFDNEGVDQLRVQEGNVGYSVSEFDNKEVAENVIETLMTTDTYSFITKEQYDILQQ